VLNFAQSGVANTSESLLPDAAGVASLLGVAAQPASASIAKNAIVVRAAAPSSRFRKRMIAGRKNTRPVPDGPNAP
jgi:hypothetical protein